MEASQQTALRKQFLEGELASLTQLVADSRGWSEAPFGQVELEEAGPVYVSMSSLEDPWWKSGLAWDGLRLHRID